MYLSHRLLILGLLLLGLPHGLLPRLVDLEYVLFELRGQLLDLLLILALYNEQRSLRPTLQGLHDDIAVPGELVVLELPRLLKVEVQVFVFNQLGLEVFVRLGLSL